MTEPKPTRFLSARLREYAEGWGQMFRDALTTADDAHEVDFYGDERTACAVYQTPVVPEGYVPPSAALVQDEEAD